MDRKSYQSKPNVFVVTIDLSLGDQLKRDLKDQGFAFSQPQYTVFSARKKGISCTLYQSGKLVVQGKEKDTFIEFYLEPCLLQEFTYHYVDVDLTGRIGVDESGKGDFFGPLCIAGVFAGGQMVSELHELGVRDSKKMRDQEILKVAQAIRENYPHHIVKINPEKYNGLYRKFNNLNRLLAWGHATIIEKMVEKSGCTNVIIDQFAAEHVVEEALQRKKIELTLSQRPRAEEDLVVAAASILAREAYIEGLDQLGQQFVCRFPKGAGSPVISFGNEFVKKYGKDALEQVAKMHFKTLDAILVETSQLNFLIRKPFFKKR